MYQISGSSVFLIVAATVCSLPAFALDSLGANLLAADDRAGGAAAAICEVRSDIDPPVLLAAYTGESPHVAAKALPTEPVDPVAGAAPPNTVLSLMQPGPRPPQVAARTVDDEQPGDWIRTAESTVPEPGLWAVLIAGFLGVCAMARPRIYSS